MEFDGGHAFAKECTAMSAPLSNGRADGRRATGNPQTPAARRSSASPGREGSPAELDATKALSPAKLRTDAGRKAAVALLLDACADAEASTEPRGRSALVDPCFSALHTRKPQKPEALASWCSLVEAALLLLARPYGWMKRRDPVSAAAIAGRLLGEFLPGPTEGEPSYVWERVLTFLPAFGHLDADDLEVLLDWFQRRTRAQLQRGDVRQKVVLALVRCASADSESILSERLQAGVPNAYQRETYEVALRATGRSAVRLRPYEDLIAQLQTGEMPPFITSTKLFRARNPQE